MCRIQVHRGGESTNFTIEGKLVGPWVMELNKCWRQEMAARPDRPKTVDLRAVSYIDADGRDLLSVMLSQGAKLEAKGCLMKSIVQEIEMQQGVQAHNREMNQ
jgi:hypothetical protein